MNLSWRRMMLNRRKSTGLNVGLSLGVEAALLDGGAHDWPKLTGICETLAHGMDLARQMATGNDMLNRQPTSLKPRIIQNSLDRLAFMLWPFMNVGGKCVWTHNWWTLNMVNWIIIRSPDFGLGHYVSFRRNERLQVQDLVLILVKHLIDLAGALTVIWVDNQHLWHNVWQKQTVPFFEHFQ